MNKFVITLAVMVLAATSSFALEPVVFGPPAKKVATGTFQAKSFGPEVRSVNDVRLVGIFDNKNGNGAVQKKLMDLSYQGINFYTTATLSTNADVNKAYAGASAMLSLGQVTPGLSVDAGVTVRGVSLDKGLRPDNSYYPTVALKVEPVTLVRNFVSTPSKVEYSVRKFVQKIF